MGRRSSRFLSNRKEMCIQLFTRKDGVKGTNRKNTITTTSPAQAISTPSRSNPLPPEPQKDHQALLVGVSKMPPKFWTPHPSISNHIYKIHHSCISTTPNIWPERIPLLSLAMKEIQGTIFNQPLRTLSQNSYPAHSNPDIVKHRNYYVIVIQ